MYHHQEVDRASVRPLAAVAAYSSVAEAYLSAAVGLPSVVEAYLSAAAPG
jgi:hypothetical protein